MKIVILTNNMRHDSGWGRYAFDLVSGIRKAGHEVLVLKEADDGSEGEIVLARGFGIFRASLHTRKYLKNCDVVHALDVYPFGIIAFLAGLFLGKKLVITAQGTYSVAPFNRISTKLLSVLACRRANLVIAISVYTKNCILKYVSPRRIEVINHGINLEKFYRERNTVAGDPYVVSVGAVKPRKGYHASVQAFDIARKKIPGLKYKIAGSYTDGDYFRKLKAVDGVEFLGRISDDALKELYAGARLFLLTSVNEGAHFEGFGLVFLEAAAAGLPVIGTYGNGIADAVRDGYNGFLVPQNDVEKTAEMMLRLLDNPGTAEKMGDAGYRWAKVHGIGDVTGRYISMYKNL